MEPFEISFDMDGMTVSQEITLDSNVELTKEEVIEGLNSGEIITGIAVGTLYQLSECDFDAIGTAKTIEIIHDCTYSDFKLAED